MVQISATIKNHLGYAARQGLFGQPLAHDLCLIRLVQPRNLVPNIRKRYGV